ncbi:winged helix-turn-helix domain-containing protein [Klebsiella spallanzanii]|uniref:OmpR/PhoB-type domain-containing protein n=1 Tax=Klebsiella spallanzanii TaxID=2587528 RepID=A0A564HJ11_9ENTR|nr:winged helix-turn-helix domain-containing protein [Klebsiella spallanzanii]VUS33372.1 hypothetical protein SB6408_00567 [Klebsiella spallanzanii]
MNYIFEDTIRFDAVDRSLTHIETDDNISLAASVSALLEYFIKNQGAVITRNTLLDDIFKKNELVDSDSNLSQNVSMLRKGFRDLGMGKDILVTKPRVGLLLPDDVKVTSIARQNTHSSPSKKNPFFCMHPLYMMWSLLLIPLLWGLFNVQSFRSSGSSSLPVAETLAGCKVHVLNNAEDARHRATALIHAESFQCDEQDIFYYLENNSVNIPFDSLVHCRPSTSMGEVCKNYLFRGHDDK